MLFVRCGAGWKNELNKLFMNSFLVKSVGLVFAAVSVCAIPACKTDLSDVWNSIDNIEDRLSDVEKKIEGMNSNIDALSKLCEALSANVSVASVVPLQDAAGYEIVFSDGTKATIRNGADGKDGHTPAVSVTYDSASGAYYWTVDGEPLLDASGNRIKANGTDAELPRLSSGASLGTGYVQDATYISVDGGKNWTRISGENGVSFFESVKADESSSKVTMVLSDGTVLEIPFVKDFMFAFAEASVEVAYGTEVEVPVTQKGVVSSQVVKPDGWKVTLKEDAVVVKAPSLANDFAETEGEVAVIAVSKSGFTVISKLKVRVLKAALASETEVGLGQVTVKYVPNEAVTSYKVYDKVFTAAEAAAIDDDSVEEKLKDEKSSEYSGSQSVTLTVPESLPVGSEAVVIAVAYNQRNQASSVSRSTFKVGGPLVEISLVKANCTSLETQTAPNGFTNYYFQWVGKKSVAEAFEGNAAEDAAGFVEYLSGKPSGTIAVLWSKKAENRTWKNLEVDTEYSFVCVPVEKKNSVVPTGAVARLDMKTLSEDEVPLPTVAVEVTGANWLYTTVKYTLNDAVTKLYCIAISQKEWNEYLTAHPGEDPRETVKANGKPYSYDGAERTSVWATQKETPIYLLAVAENEVGKLSDLAQVSYTTPSYIKGKSTVDIAVSDVKATSAHSVCTPSSDAAYYLLKQAADAQWKAIDQQEQGGIYEYVCRNGVKLVSPDVYDWTGLVVDTDYTIYCVAVDQDGNYGELAQGRFRTAEEEGEDSPEYSRFIGDWTMSYTDFLTKSKGSMQIKISRKTTGKSFYVSGLMTEEYVSKYSISDASIVAPFSDGKILLNAATSVREAGKVAEEAGRDYKFCGFTKGTANDEPSVFFRPNAGLVGTYSDGRIEFADNGAVGGQYILQGYCWLAFDSQGNPIGRADAVIPVDISFEKNPVTSSAAASAQESGRTVSAASKGTSSPLGALPGFKVF